MFTNIRKLIPQTTVDLGMQDKLRNMMSLKILESQKNDIEEEADEESRISFKN